MFSINNLCFMFNFSFQGDTLVNCYKIVPFIDCENVRAHFLPWSTTNLMYRQRFRSLLITKSSTHCATFNVLSYLLRHTGQKITSRALRRQEFIPKCPAWSLFFMSSRIDLGITTRSPRNRMPSCTDSSSR